MIFTIITPGCCWCCLQIGLIAAEMSELMGELFSQKLGEVINCFPPHSHILCTTQHPAWSGHYANTGDRAGVKTPHFVLFCLPHLLTEN